MPVPPKAFPKVDSPIPDSQLQKLYESGCVGAAKAPPWATERLKDVIRNTDGGVVDASDACHRFGLAETGKGKLILNYEAIELLYPGSLPGPGQDWGDSTPAGTLIRMADGTLRPIESIEPGEYVISAKNRVCRVKRAVSHPARLPNLLVVKFKGRHRPLKITPDHQVLQVPEPGSTARLWKRIDDLEPGDFMLAPRGVDESKTSQHVLDVADYFAGEIVDDSPANAYKPIRLVPAKPGQVRAKNGESSCNRRIPLDHRLAWLLGIYAAEGSLDLAPKGHPRRVTLNIGSHRMDHAVQAADYFRALFGVRAEVTQVPSKPHVIYVRVGNALVAGLFAALCPGNVYSKSITPLLFTSPKDVRLACVRGWFDGDGCAQKGKSGVAGSVSFELAAAMTSLANSCGLDVREKVIRPKGKRRDFLNLRFPRGAMSDVYRDHSPPSRGGAATAIEKTALQPLVMQDGTALEIESVQSIPAPETVYCLEVEEDQSFIAEGVAIHNCVSHGGKNAGLITMCGEIVSGQPDEISKKIEEAPKLSPLGIQQGVLCPETLFWWRKHADDGWFCEECTEVMLKSSGTMLRQKYPELGLDLEKYSLANSKLYGRTPPTGEIAAECAKRLFRTATLIKEPEAYRDLCANGYGINTCGSEGFDENWDEHGVSRRKGTWHHSMAGAGVDDRPEIHSKYGEMLCLVWQSWGPGWGRKGAKIYKTDITLPPGFFFVKWSEWKRRYMVAISGHNGWPRQLLPDSGWGKW